MDKTSAQRIVRETFKAAFDRKRFRDFINELCNGFDESKAPSMLVPDAFMPHIKSCQRLGTFESADGELADVLIVHLTESYKLERTRTALRDFVAHKLKRDESYKEAGMVAFVAPDSKSWRFSFVRMEYETKRDPVSGKIKPELRLTPARRHSYLVGEDEECHTAQSRFLALLQNTSDKPTLAQIEDAFSVESVSKEFFREYARLFEATEAALTALVAKDKTLRAEFAAKHVNTADFTKKLLGQIVFLYFIQKKGWLGVAKGGKWGDGPRNFLRQLATQSIEIEQNLFNDVLEPLFYDTLANDRGHEAWCKTFQCRIPFLNGGLFEPLAGYDWEHTEITLPNSLLTNRETNNAGDIGTGILDVFDRYNFTVMEDEPLEKEVAIDPEMLGKVFENLIEENRRKGLGAYYTPREIVHYMCQESLINYLDTALNHPMKPFGMAVPGPETPPLFVDSDELPKAQSGQQEFLEAGNLILVPREELAEWISQSDQFAHYAAAIAAGTKGDHYPKPPASIRKYAREMDVLLRDITVCDPAVGSGAFLVGMMNEIVRARMALTPYFNDMAERTAYHFKRRAIQYSLYGVDIDAGAVEIAKLRLWLSLVVDEEDVQQIKPLPNLDYKIVAGNSLLGVEQNLFNQGLFKKLEELKPKFFNESERKKKSQFKKQIDDLIHELTSGREVFDYETYFSEVFHSKQGFDVVIANPPYLGESGNKETFRLIAASPLGRRFYTRKMDLIYFFFHLALDLAKQDGSMCFITTSYWITADGAIKLRTDLKARATIRQLLNFGELRLFATAQGQHNMITLLTKSSDGDVARTLITKRSGEAKPELVKLILAGRDGETDYFQIAPQQLFSDIDNHIRLWSTNEQAAGYGSEMLNLAKIDSMSRPLADYVECVFKGVETGCDVVRGELIQAALKKGLITPSQAGCWKIGMGIYVLSAEELGQLHLTSDEERDCVKHFYKNSDIMRYYTPFKKPRFLLYVDSSTDINLYPHIRKHLEQFRPLLAAREQAVTESHNWFWIRGAKRKSLFYREDSIVVPYRATSSRFSACSQDIFGASDVYYITLKREFSNQALLGFLNSSLVHYHLRHRGKRKGEIIEYFKSPLEKVPIHKQLLEDNICTRSFENVVEKIVAAKRRDPDANTSALEREVDELVYALYDLTHEEIALIEATD